MQMTRFFSSNQRCLLLISNEDIHLYSISSNCNQMERIWLRSYMPISYYNNRCYRIFYSRFCFLSVTNLCMILICSRIKFTFRTGHKNLQNFPSFLFKWPFAFCPPSFLLPNDLTRWQNNKIFIRFIQLYIQRDIVKVHWELMK